MIRRPAISDELRRGFADPAFWAAEARERGAKYDLGGDCTTTVPLGDEHTLHLFTTRDLEYVSRGLMCAVTFTPVELGWDDQAGWHPHCLRWTELDLVSRLAAALDPTLPHPGTLMLLLSRFAPACSDADASLAGPSLAAGCQSVGLPVSRRWGRLDRRAAGFRWVHTGAGLLIMQSEADRQRGRAHLYSLRSDAADEFPLTALTAALAAAEQAYRASVPAAWRTDTVRALATAAVGDLRHAPVLADALDDAGHDRPDLTSNLRSGVPARAGWVAEWLLGDCSGDCVRRHAGPPPAPSARPLALQPEDDG